MTLPDEILYIIFKLLTLDDKRTVRLVTSQFRKIVDKQIQLILVITDTPTYDLFDPSSSFQYLTTIPITGPRNELTWGHLPKIQSSPCQIFHKKLTHLVIGPSANGISTQFLAKVFHFCAKTLKDLIWTVNVVDNNNLINHNNQQQSIFFLTDQPVTFDKLTQLSLQLIVKPSKKSDSSKAFIKLVENYFPKLYSLSIHLVSESEWDTASRQFVCGESTWGIYFEIFNFISRHGQTLRILALDYSHLTLKNVMDDDPWAWAVHHQNIKKISTSFSANLTLHNLQLYCPDKEGVVPWILGTRLLTSQNRLRDLSLKVYGNPRNLYVDTTLRCNGSLKSLHFSNPSFSAPFDLSLLSQHKDLRDLELVHCSSLVNTFDIATNIRNLKLRTVYTKDDLLDILEKCSRLRKLYLHHNGTFGPVTLDMFQICVNNSDSLRQLDLDRFEIEPIVQFCNQHDDLHLSIRRRNKARLKIESN